jgi:DNA-binding ferritin-like protein
LLLTNANTYQYEWLERDSPVPAGYVFEVAESLHRPISEVCERLRLLGYTAPDEATLLAEKILASKNLDGKAPWRNSRSRLTAKEITFITERLGVDDIEIAERMRKLGYDAPSVVDAVLANGGLIDGNAWLSPGNWIGARQVLRAAQELGLNVTEIVDRYGDLGFETADAVGSLELMALDGGDGKQLWEIRRRRIRREWVSRAADKLSMSTEEATRRLRDEGFVVLDATPDSYLDEAIISEIGEFSERENVVLHSQSDPVDRSTIVKLAGRSGQQAVRVAADLQTLGFIVPSVNDLGVVDDELQQICAQSWRISIGPWSFGDSPVPVGVVIEVASGVSRPVDYVAQRLRSVGYTVPDTASLTDEDRFLVSRGLDGEVPPLAGHRPVTVWHLVRAAIKLDKDPRLIARRMRELGYEVPEGWAETTRVSEGELGLGSPAET